MRNLLKLMFAASWVLGALSYAAAQSASEKAIIENLQGSARVEVSTGKNRPTEIPKGALFLVNDDDERVQVTDVLVISGANVAAKNFGEFSFEFPASQPFDPKATYEVVVSFPAEKEGKVRTLLRTIPVTPRISSSLERDDQCANGNGITLVLKSNLDEHDWMAVYNWLDEFKNNPSGLATVKVRPIGTSNADGTVGPENFKPVAIESFEFERFPPGSKFNVQTVCFKFAEHLPTKNFAVEMTLHGSRRPPEVEPVVTAKKLAGRTISAADDSLERNLDLSLTMSSSVANEDVPATATDPATVVRQRTNRGVVDVKFKPWIDIFHPIIEDNTWIHYFTPFYLDASVATGKITEDTLALNRVLFGFEGEARYRQVKDTDEDFNKIATHRLMYGLTHASDRDFKQDEFTGKIEYKPIIWKFNSPINLNYTLNKKGEKTDERWFGYTFLPTFGFEIGKTYHRRNPAPAIKPSDTVRRFYIGLDLGLDVTRHLTFTVSDTFYLRGETPGDRAKNYFKGGVEAPLGEVFNSAVHGLFFTFERGDLAPFATPSVNALKFGYRIQANYCAPNCR